LCVREGEIEKEKETGQEIGNKVCLCVCDREEKRKRGRKKHLEKERRESDRRGKDRKERDTEKNILERLCGCDGEKIFV
jgi:hypothetical protein